MQILWIGRDSLQNWCSRPVQFDLMDSQAADGPSCALGALRANHIPAGSYRQVRLQLVSDHPDSSEPVPQHNECAGIGFNCVVGNNGEKHALVLDGAGQFLRSHQTRIAMELFHVIADTETRLSISFPTPTRRWPHPQVTQCESLRYFQ